MQIGWFYHLMNGLIIVFAATFFFGIPILSLIVIEGSFKNPPPLGKAYGCVAAPCVCGRCVLGGRPLLKTVASVSLCGCPCSC